MDSRPLDGIVVIDSTQLLPGAFTTRRLADLGARVTRILRPDQEMDAMSALEGEMGGDGSLSEWLNAGKELGHHDLRDAARRDQFFELLANADVWVESFTPQQSAALGVTPEAVSGRCPRLVRCTITACGVEEPLAARAGHDLSVLAMSGVLSVLAEEGGRPIVPGIQVAGVGAGALPAIEAILAALFGRERSGRGGHCIISMLHELEAWLGLERSLEGRRTTPRGWAPCYGIYETGDGRYVALAAAKSSLWEAFCGFAERPDWLERRFDADIRDAVQEFIRGRTFDQWVAVSRAQRTGVEPVMSVAEALAIFGA